MAFLGWFCSKRALALAAAAAVALGVGMVATPNEAAAQCAVVSTGPNDPGTVSTFQELRDLAAGPAAGDSVSVDCDNSIDSDSIVDGTITGTDIGAETITGANIDDGTIGVDDLGTASVGSDEVIDNSLTSDDLAANSVTDSELADDAVDTAAIQDGAVNSAKVEDNSLTADDLAANSVTASELADDAVDTAAIQDNAVTWDKLSSGVRNRIDENTEGVAIALALQNPDLVGNETFGLSVNWGGFDSSNAIGIAATGVLAHDFLGGGDRLAIAGGVGFGLDKDTVGGRVGAQLTW
jgi:hypothetical protein